MKNRSHRFLSLLLCAVLMASLVVTPAYAAETHDHAHDHEIKVISAAQPDIAAFAAPMADTQADDTTGVPSGECKAGGAHEWVLGETHKGAVCSGADVGRIQCKKCGETRGSTADEHLWSNWETTAASCEQPGSRTRHCTRTGCSAVQTETVQPTGHKYRTVTKAATATTCTATYRECTVCGHIDGNTSPAHNWVKVSGDCTAIAVCSVCNTKNTSEKTYSQHKFGGEYIKTAEGHYQKCQNPNCEVTSAVTAHTAASVTGDCTKGTTCRVCGYEGVTGQQHDFSKNWVVSTNASGHVVRCSNPNCNVTMTVSHIPGATASCTEATKCTVCNYTISGGGAHAYGPISGGDNLGCIRKCTKCGAEEHISHTGENDDSDCTTAVKCTTCGYVLVPAYSGHDYSSTIWYSGGESGHYTTCVHPGCKFTVTQPHTGGTATCRSAAICAVCGASYGSKSAGNHDGGTEIRNAKAATVGAEGYTGDTYCLGCNQKIASGSTIPALAESHTHSYGSDWTKDSTGHWHACSCGDKKDVAAHTFQDGKCTACGEADPDYKETEGHIHTYSGVWSGDSQHHWHACTACGEKADQDVHRFLNGVCLECGMTFEQHKAEEKKEQAQEGNAPTVPVYEKFSDIAAGRWYTNDIQRIVDAGLMEGTSDTTFSPGSNLTRGQLVTILYRFVGEPSVSGGSRFSDVRATAYYAGAVSWAAASGVVEGSGGKFAPGKNITRQDLVTILWRYAKQAGYDMSSGSKVMNFKDQGKVASYAAEAMAWAYDKGIVEGSDNMLLPTATATRAQAAAMLVRFMNLPVPQ